MTNEEILNIELYIGCSKTIREYFAFCAAALWLEGDGFSGKRPVGDSGWQTDIYIALVRAGAVRGVFDEDGELDECDYDEADELVVKAIESMATEVKPEPKRQMVLFESVPSGSYIAIDPSEVSSVSHNGSESRLHVNGVSVHLVQGSIPEVAAKLGIELVESKGTVK